MTSAYYFASRTYGGNNSIDFDPIPEGADLKDFYSRPVSGHSNSNSNDSLISLNSKSSADVSDDVNAIINQTVDGDGSVSFTFNANGSHNSNSNSNANGSSNALKTLTEQKVAPQEPGADPPIGSLLLRRKVPMKVCPKGMFAAERTFMQWMHTSLWLLGASLTIISYSNNDPIKLLYGAFIFPVALAFTVYSVYQFRRRVLMLRVKCPGPYQDTWGPVVLTIMLMTAIIAQFVTKIVYLF